MSVIRLFVVFCGIFISYLCHAGAIPSGSLNTPLKPHSINGALTLGITDVVIESIPGIKKLICNIYEPLGYDIIFLNLPPKRSLVLGNNGDIDGISVRIADIGNSDQLIRIKEPLIDTKLRAWSKPRIQYDSLSDLSQYLAVVVNGTQIHKNASKEIGANIIMAPSLNSALKMIQSDRADFIIHNEAILPIAESMGLNSLVPSREIYSHLKLYHYINKKHLDMVAAITTQIAQMNQNKLDIHQ